MGLTDAARAYGTMEQGTLDLAPRSRFNFRLELLVKDTASSSLVFERIKSVSLPSISFDTQIANQYNQKRVVQTKINYGTCSVTFYDTYDNRFFDLIQSPYIKNYYHNGKGIENESQTISDNVITDTFSIGNKGYYLVDSDSPRYYIEEAKLSLLGPSENRKLYRMKNCMITDISGDNLDYSDSNPVEITVTFQPEYVDIIKTS